MSVVLIIVPIIVFTFTICLIIGVYQKNTNAICKSKKSLRGKTTLITGGTIGMGLEIAMDFAHRGARVIIACPFEEEGTNARASIVETTGNEDVVFKLLDLGSLKSVRKFASDILNTENRLDILVNNAGVGIPNDSLTDDGMNFIMQVNYFGHFLLTLLLLPLMKKMATASEPSRIVNTSSVLHLIGKIDIDHLNAVNYWYRIQIYGNSKLCMVPFSRELTKRLEGSNVVANSIDPGAVGTRIFYSAGKFLGFIGTFCFGHLFKTPWEGAQTAIHVAVDHQSGKISGGFFKNCKLSRAKPSAYDEKIAMKLWTESVRLVKLTDDEIDNCFKSL